MSYLNITEVESALVGLASTYPAVCELITLPNPSIEGRTTHAVRIGTASATSRDGVLLTGGVHAREWGSSEICVSLAADLCEAFTGHSGLSYGGRSFDAAEVQALVEGLNWYVFADVNPDGRDYSQNSEAMWRRNRNAAESGGNDDCVGVDLNRNHDFLWDFPNLFASGATVNTSTSPCSSSQTYRGSAAVSEPETKNVVWLLDTFPRIRWYVDLHSSGQMILHSWGDDQDQSSDSSQHFLNAAFNNVRGLDGDSAYREFMPADDFNEATTLANTMHDAIHAVRGTEYSVGPAFDLYATSGANDDYAYSRHFADASKGKVIAYTVEWGTEFQPPWSEMEHIVADISAGLLAFASQAVCLVESVVELQTPTITFNDVPEGETTARAVVFDVTRCGASTFHVTTSSGPFGVLPSPTASLATTVAPEFRQSRIWLSFQGLNDGDVASGSVTIKLVETGEQWNIPITANTIARPTVAVALVLDQSGSMTAPSGVAALPTRNDALKFSAPIFVNVLPEGDGIGIVDFDHDAYDRLNIEVAGPPSAFDVARADALNVIAAHAPNINGLTAIGDGVEHAHNMLSAVTGFDNKAMVVFTDGFETADKRIAEVAPLIDDRVFAIGLGTADQVQPSALNALTNGSGGYMLLTGELGNTDLFRLSKYYLQVLAGVTNHDIVLDPEGYVLPGQVVRIPFHLNEADIETDVILLSDWPPQAFIFALETPAGDVINPSVATSLGGEFVVGSGLSYYRMTLPVALGAGAHAGKWSALIAINPRYDKRVPGNGLHYSLSVHSYSGIRLIGSSTQTTNEPGARVTVRGVLTEYGIPVNDERVDVRVEIQRPDGTAFEEPMYETIDGTYETTFVAGLQGVYPMRILAKGKSLRGRPFTREHLLTAATWRELPPSEPNPWCKLLECVRQPG